VTPSNEPLIEEMKYLLVNYAYVIPCIDDDLDKTNKLILYNDPEAIIIVCDTIEECYTYAPLTLRLRR